jgi:hypothetical protein
MMKCILVNRDLLKELEMCLEATTYILLKYDILHKSASKLG